MKPDEAISHPYGAEPLLRHGARWRKRLLLGLDFAVFISVNVFWYYLATGNWFDFSSDAYYHDLVTPLGRALIHPVSVLSHPWLIFVAGLLLAAAMAVPILIAILYPIGWSLLMAAGLGLIGHAPVLSVAVAIGSVITARTPLRSDLPFLAFLLGLLPSALYLSFFGISDRQLAQILPLQRWVLAGPLVVAVVTAILAAAATLALTKLFRYRPGAVVPVIGLMLAGAIGSFYSEIGVDELEYALIADDLAPGDLVFQPRSLEEWHQSQGAEGLTDQRLTNLLQGRMDELRLAKIQRCEDFLQRHHDSQRAPSVLWIEAQCRSLQLDLPAVNAGTVRFSASHPLAASGQTWERLRERFPASPQALLAGWKLAELALRDGRVHDADELLFHTLEALTIFRERLAERLSASPKVVFRPMSSVPSPGYYDEAFFRIRRLLWLIDRNRALEDKRAAEALTAMLRINPHQSDLAPQIAAVIARYEGTKLGDNLKLAYAMAIRDPYERAEHLIALAADERTDAAVEANYQLGMLTMQTARARALPLMPELQEPAHYFRTVIAAPPNPWQPLAREHLSRLTEPGGE